MEHKHKLLSTTTTSSQAQGTCIEISKDRFSDLPDEVAHLILSFLKFRELVAVGSVSKRCRELYLSTPVLYLSSSDTRGKRHMLHLLNDLDRFLILRGNNKIERLDICWDLIAGLSKEIFRFIRWIHIAARCNVEVLNFRVSSRHRHEALELPSSIFLCPSLRSLLVDMDTMLKVPSVTCSSNIQYLTLNNVRIDDRFCTWICSSCKCLKKLKLYEVEAQTITIESSSLESFCYYVPYYCEPWQFHISGEKLSDIDIQRQFGTSMSWCRSVNIVAPNLKYLKWVGNLPKRYNLGKLMFLKKAQILLKCRLDHTDFDLDIGFEILRSISWVKSLILTEDTTKALCREGSMPVSFNNISELSMHIGCLNDDLVPPMASLLSGMPNLSTLCISTYPSISLLLGKPKLRSCRFNRKYWISQNLGFVDKLKLVTIELSHGSNSWELARYILEHAENLEKMVIFYLPKQSYVTRRASKWKIVSNAAVIIREKLPEQKIRRDMWRDLYHTSLG